MAAEVMARAALASVVALSAAPVLPHPWSAILGDLRLGQGTPYRWTHREGFLDLPSLRSVDVPRPDAHGTFAQRDWADGRYLTAGFQARRGIGGVEFDTAVHTARRTLVPSEDVVPLWVNIPGIGPVRWDVKVRRARVVTDQAFNAGLARVDVQLYAPDPVGYGDELGTWTGFPLMVGGLEFDLFTDDEGVDTGYLEFGESGGTGRVALVNDGTADSWPRYRVAGPVVDGFEILDVPSGRRLRFEGDVAAGSAVSIDTATGVVLLDDVADRSGLLTVREWIPVSAGSTTEVMFLPLGSYTAASLTITWAPAWW